ncbi:MAG TPA: hypothetical protein VH988_35460 [Thermoanaerobaculia bacterium]|nr:hypothetical protein [Thermoanaerobaculia bacterium]
METARRDSWKTQPMPQETVVLGYSEEFSSEEFEKISRGLITEEMEDKWFIYLDETTLHLHRSWTGICIYYVELEEIAGKYTVRRALVNRNQTQYQATDDAYDSQLLHFLISNLLLGRQVEFPVPEASSSEAPKGIFQHHISGTAYPEKPVGTKSREDAARRKVWWKFW